MRPTRPSRQARTRHPASRAPANGRLPLAIALALVGLSGTALAAPQDSASGQVSGDAAAATSTTDLDAIMVVGQRASRVSNGATNLDLDIKETPQSISVVTSEQMSLFGANSVNDALRLATGVRVDEWETNRTSYSARGFDILNTQIDGVGLPNSWGIATGAQDTFGYEKVEVIRGANGLLTGVGNASGTINYVRKRPTNEAQGMVGLSYGSWDTVRVEADYSTPFTDDGRWAGRIVAAYEDGDSWLQANQNDRTFVYGVVDGQIGDNGTLTVGYSHQQANSVGIMWGALLFMNSDGTQNEWPRNATTTQDWTYWDTTNETAFVEYVHQLGADWRLNVSYNYRRASGDEDMFYAYLADADFDGTPEGLDPATGLGLVGYPWSGKDEVTSHLGTVSLNGVYNMFGRQHEAVIGVSASRSTTDNWERSAEYPHPAWGLLPPFPYPTDAIPEPAWSEFSQSAQLDQNLKRVFGATRIAVTDRFKAIIGANYAEYRREGVSYGVDFDDTTSHTSPYAGLTFDFTDGVLGYVSYSDIYQPQDQADANDRLLGPSKGVNYEAGIKAEWLDGRLLTTVAVFKADQQGLATPTGEYNDFGQTIYAPVDVKSKGVEFEATGQLSDNVDLVVGYTALKMDGLNGEDTYPWVPRRSANLILSARAPGFAALSYGLGGRWQSEISNTESSGFTVRQGSYAVLNAFMGWDFVENATVRLNVNNVFNEKYINTLRYSGYYGAPSNYTVTLNWRF